jgi:hypothetical protein
MAPSHYPRRAREGRVVIDFKFAPRESALVVLTHRDERVGEIMRHRRRRTQPLRVLLQFGLPRLEMLLRMCNGRWKYALEPPARANSRSHLSRERD